MLFILIIIGSAIFVSSFVVHVRKRAFETRFDHIAELRRRVAHERRSRSRRRSASLAGRLSRSVSRSDNLVFVPRSVISPRKDENKEENKDESKDAEESVDIKSSGNTVTDTIVGNFPDSGKEETEGTSNITQFPNEKESTPKVDSSGPSGGSLEPTGPVQPESPISPRTARPRTLTYRSEAGDEISVDHPATSSQQNAPLTPLRITFAPDTYYHADLIPTKRQHHNDHRFISMQGVGAEANASIKRRLTNTNFNTTDENLENVALKAATNHLPFLNSGYVSRNSQFHHLSEVEREHLGGYEYRAVRFLAWLVPLYFVFWQFFGCLGLGAYVANNRAATARQNGLNPWWVGSFNAVSAFNNSGMSLLDANMVAFQTSSYMLITMGLLILAGNTCYPIFLRLIVWALLKILPNDEEWEDWRITLQFLLDHPRRCYTNMFPSRHTWWLLSSVICLNGIDWAAFEILNLGNDAITSLPKGIKVLDGLFQAFAVRSGGFYVVPIPSVRISLQVLYVIMMYISVYPVVITMRNSNVYEERSLGIYVDDPRYGATHSKSGISFFGKLRRTMTGQPFEQTKSYFVRQQLRAQLAHDLWWIVLAVFLIMIIEGSNFQSNPTTFSVFNVLFEVVSGYGCVGISVGLPDQAYSFCGAWHTLSKLILCAVMIRGRHRGLPVAIDKAVLLPGEALYEAEEEDAQIRVERTISRGRAV